MEWYIAEQSHAKLLTLLPCAVEAEDVVLVATIRAGESAHVLNHAQDRYINFLEEINTSHCIS